MRLGTCLLIGGHTPQGALHKLADFCSAPVAGFYSAVDSQHAALMALEPQAIIASLPHDQFAGPALTMQCVCGDGDAADIKHLNQLTQGQDPATAPGALSNPKGETCPMCKGRDNVHIRLPGGLVKAASHLFAINGDGRVLTGASRKVGAKLVSIAE